VRYAVQAFAIAMREPGVKQMLWYNVVAPPAGAGHGERIWDTALLAADGRPRPEFDALSAWAAAQPRRGMIR